MTFSGVLFLAVWLTVLAAMVFVCDVAIDRAARARYGLAAKSPRHSPHS